MTKNEQIFVDYHLELVKKAIVEIDSLYPNLGTKDEDFDCEEILSIKMFEQLNRHLSQYDNMGHISFMFNQPSFCGQSIVTNFIEKEGLIGGDYSKGDFDFKINESLTLEVDIHGFNKSTKQAKEFSGIVSFIGINQTNEVIYTGKYNVIATIFIPKDFKKWNELIGSKTFKEIVTHNNL